MEAAEPSDEREDETMSSITKVQAGRVVAMAIASELASETAKVQAAAQSAIEADQNDDGYTAQIVGTLDVLRQLVYRLEQASNEVLA